MTTFEYGPAEVYIIRYQGALPDDRVLGALADLIADDTIRLLDIIVVNRDDRGVVNVLEIDDLPTVGEPLDIALVARGIAGNDDIEQVAAALPPGSSAAIAVIELVWAKALAERFAESGGDLLDTVRIPAPDLNLIAEAAHIK